MNDDETVQVLVVDDDAAFGDLCVGRLERAGYSARLLEGPFGTVNEVRRCRPRLLLLDVKMPGVPGEKVAELVNELQLPDLKMLFISSLDVPELEQITKRAGAHGCVSKSAPSSKLLAAVRSVIGPPH